MGRQLTLLRHSGGARLAHLLLATVIAWLILSGLGVHESLSAGMIHALGGHVLLATSHRWLGYTLGAALLPTLVFLRHRLREFLVAIMGFQRADMAWLPGLLRSLLHPRKAVLPWHAGRFDPGQRLVFLILVSSLALLVITGIALNFIPLSTRMVFAWTLRTHLAAAWVCIGAIGVHVFAGLGVLPTHRGVTRAMFGDGRTSVELSRRLWPGWTAHQPGTNVRKPTATDPATTKLP